MSSLLLLGFFLFLETWHDQPITACRVSRRTRPPRIFGRVFLDSTYRPIGCALRDSAYFRFHDALETPGKAEVTYLDRAIIVNQDVCWFQISVNYRGFVEIVQPTEHVIDNRLHLRFFDVFRGF